MKRICLLIIMLLQFGFISTLIGQENALISGSAEFLKQEKTFNVVFSYDEMAVGVYRNEKEFIQKKVNEYNNATPGKGDKWLVKWNEKKYVQFPKSFLVNLNKKTKKANLKADTNLTNAKYTFWVKPYFLEEGWDAVVESTPAVIRLTISVCETADKTKQVAEFRITGEYYRGDRSFGGIFAFEDAGKNFGKFLLKYL